MAMLEAPLHKTRPMVSVGLMTYNHGEFIGKAIESVLMQEVNFPFELVIAEDCSTDNTREIILEYKEKYPDVIRLLLQDENVGMKQNSNDLRRACWGKYRANLEGDDYWIDPSKLQKQVDFLESNPDFVAIGGDFSCIDDRGRPCPFPWGDIRYSYCQDEEYTAEHLREWLLFGHTSTMMFKNFFYDCGDDVNQRFDNVNMLGDRRICLFLVMNGRVRHQKEVWTIRRVLKKSASSMTNAVKNSNYLGVNYEWLVEAERYCREEFNYTLDMRHKKEQRWLGSLKLFFRNANQENYQVMKYIFETGGDKKRYIRLACGAVYRNVKESIKNNGFWCTVKKGVKKGFSILKKLTTIRKQKNTGAESGKKSVMESFSAK
ncbi:MAG: glycosyltransferase [Oscillospiraceae bacterium]|nr:glycosyltransferase [Oscillospiraceae bacterium]